MASSTRDVLPATVKPKHYCLSLSNLEFAPQWTYQGVVKIDLQIKEEVAAIEINCLELKIHEAELASIKCTKVDYNEKKHRATITFSETIQATDEATLTIKFSGVMNRKMAGFYRSGYKPVVQAKPSVPVEDDLHFMLSTQFESCDARRAFPCFDEPNLKATFDFEIEIPEDQVALSNMPEKATKASPRSGWKTVSFERSPIMSTYLLAWAVGDFSYVEAFTERLYDGKALPVRVYTTRGLEEQGQYALEHAHKTIDLFSSLFKIDFPLPKMDMLAVHEFSHGAMENFGLITYRTTAVLFEEGVSADAYRNRVAYVVAHELAHQWFGNLVTMDWWSALWLNEGFATWVGWYAVDVFHKDWCIWGQFVTEATQGALRLDGMRASHAVEVEVRDALEVDQIFDAISYLKGASCIRMLAAHLGVEVFLEGVSNYLKKYKYGNAVTEDLWHAVSESSLQDVPQLMNPFIRKIGFPVVTVVEEPGQISLKQERFLTTGDVKAEDDTTIWTLPLALRTSSTSVSTTTLSAKEDVLRNIDESFYLINTDATGFFRTNYPPSRLAKLGTQKDQLSIEDKIGIIGDAASLAISGHGTTASLLTFIEPFQNETSKVVWAEILSSLGNVRSVFSGNDKVASALRAFTLKLVSPAAEKLGWEFPAGEDFLTSQLRVQLLSSAGLAGHNAIIAEAQKKFEAYMSGDKSAIHANLRGVVFRLAITNGGKKEYEAVKNEFMNTTSIDGKEICLSSMGRVQTEALAKDVFAFMMSGKVAVQDMHTPAMALAGNSKVRETLWKCIKGDWENVRSLLSTNMVVLDRFLRVACNKFSSREIGTDIDQFFADKDNSGYDRSLSIIKDTVAGNANYLERDEARLAEWLSAKAYE